MVGLHHIIRGLCRCSGRPFVEAKVDPTHPFQRVAARWFKQLKFTLISLPIWTGVSVLLLVKFLMKYNSCCKYWYWHLFLFLTNFAMVCSPVKFLAKKDRQGIHYGDPFPGMEHRYIEANGIRYVQASDLTHTSLLFCYLGAGQPCLPPKGSTGTYVLLIYCSLHVLLICVFRSRTSLLCNPT